MKFTINASDFRSALKDACDVAPSKGILPEQSCLYLIAGENALTIQARSDSAEISLTVPCDTQETGEALIPSRMLLDYVSLASGEVAVSTDKKLRMTIKSGKKTSTVAGLETHRFKALEFGGYTDILSVPGAEFAACINRTAFCTSADESRAQICGVHLSIDNMGRIRFVGMDGVKVSMCRMDETDLLADSAEGWELTIPNAALRLISGQFSDDEKVTLSMDRWHLCLSAGDKKMIVSLISKPYLDIDRVIPASYSSSVLVDGKAFTEALKLVEIAAGAAATNDARWNIVRIQTDGQNRCVYLSADNESTEAATTVDMEQRGENLTIFFNVRFLRDLASACVRESDELEISFTSAVGIASIRPVNTSCGMVTYVVPVRTNRA